VRHRAGVLTAAIAALALFVAAGTEAGGARDPCEVPQHCLLGTYDIQASGRLKLTDAHGAVIEAITITGTFKKLLIEAEIRHDASARPGGRRNLTTISFSKQTGGIGSITSTLLYRTSGCDFTKTFRHAALVELEANVILGFQPTRLDLVKRLMVPAELEFLGGAGNPSTQIIEYEPRVGSLCPDQRDELLNDLMGGGGAGKCVDPAGARLTYDRNCLAVTPFGVRFTLQVTKRQTLKQLAYPLNRVWARKSFTVEANTREVIEDGSASETHLRITFRRRAG
jgi:hypothetical protein